MSMFANNALFGGGVSLRFGLENIERSKGTTKHLMANLDITPYIGSTEDFFILID